MWFLRQLAVAAALLAPLASAVPAASEPTGYRLKTRASYHGIDEHALHNLTARATFTNPIHAGAGADPWVLEYNNVYYLTYTVGDRVRVFSSSTLASFDGGASADVYVPAAGTFTDVWAPELHLIDGAFYVYVAMDTVANNNNHRMYVLKGTSATDPMQPFSFVGKLNTPDDNWAIDGTVLIYGNGQLYFIWSGWTDPANTLWQNLYIAPMSSPTALAGARVLLHQPTPSWQQTVDSGGVHGINEGPEILVNAGRTFLVYSAAGSWTQDYCLAFMGIDGGADPLVASNWWTLDTRPVFSSSSVAFGPGHASFPYDHNGVPYIVYHAMADPNAGWDGRTIRTQSFGWNPDNSPAFPSPVALGVALPAPA